MKDRSLYYGECLGKEMAVRISGLIFLLNLPAPRRMPIQPALLA